VVDARLNQGRESNQDKIKRGGQHLRTLPQLRRGSRRSPRSLGSNNKEGKTDRFLPVQSVKGGSPQLFGGGCGGLGLVGGGGGVGGGVGCIMVWWGVWVWFMGWGVGGGEGVCCGGGVSYDGMVWVAGGGLRVVMWRLCWGVVWGECG